MTRHDDDDRWLDAFSPEDLEDPELAALDAAVSRVLAGFDETAGTTSRANTAGIALPPISASGGSEIETPTSTDNGHGRTSSMWPRAPLYGGLMLLAATALLYALLPPSAPAPSDAPLMADAVTPAPSDPPMVVAPEAVAVKDAQPAEVSDTRIADGQAHNGRPRERTAPKPTVSIPRDPAQQVIARSSAVTPTSGKDLGLLPTATTTLHIDGASAVLTTGNVRFVRDSQHDPVVTSIRLTELPLVANPIGTTFELVARRNVAALRVDQGRVHVEHTDGTVLANVTPGRELVAIPNRNIKPGFDVLETTGLSLDAVQSLVPADCLCRSRDVIASVASLRLARAD